MWGYEKFNLVSLQDKHADRQYVDNRKNILAQKWDKIENESRQKKNLHYQDVQFDEARSHGVGFMNFSRDEKEREAQHSLLKDYRNETIAASAFNAEECKRKKKQLDERLRKVRDRKRLKLGYPIIEPEDDPLKTPPLSDEEDGVLKVTEPLVVSSNLQEVITDDISSNLRKIREWDLGKPSIDRVMTQEQYTESRRQFREKEFAPPKLYSDRISNEGSYKGKKSIQNRLKTSSYNSDTDVRSSPYQRNHQNSIYNRLNYNTDAHTFQPDKYPARDGTFNTNVSKEFDRENINKGPWDKSNAWSKNKETEFPKFLSENADTESNKDLGGFVKAMNIDSGLESQKAFSQNVNSSLNASHDMHKQAEYDNAFGDKSESYNSVLDRTWDPSNRGAEFNKPCLPERNSDVVQSNQIMNSEANIYLNKNYGDDGKINVEPADQNDNKNIGVDAYAPGVNKGGSKWDQGSSSKMGQSYDSNTVSKYDCQNPLLNSDSGPTRLMDIPSQYDEAWESKKKTVFNDYGAQNSTETSWIDQARCKNRMRLGSSEFSGGWGSSRNTNLNNITGGSDGSGDLAKASSHYSAASEICNSSNQRNVTEFHEASQNGDKVYNRTWSANRNSRFDEVAHTEFSSAQLPKRNAKNMEFFNAYKFNETPGKMMGAEYDEYNRTQDTINNTDQFKNVEADGIDDQNQNKYNDKTWGPNENVDNSRGQNSNKEIGDYWGPSKNSDFNKAGNKNENLAVKSTSSQNMGNNFDKVWTPSRSAELDLTFSRFRNASGGSANEKWSSNRNKPSDYNQAFGQRNKTKFFPQASTSAFRWTKPPPQQDSITIEQAISDGLMKLRKEFDNTPV